MRWSHTKNIEETKAIIIKLLCAYKNPTFYQWAIILKENNENVGEISLPIVDEIDLCGGTGYCIGKKYWGQGIATEALNAILKEYY